MKAIKFDGELTDDNVSKLLENIDKHNKDEEIILYFCSNGGGVSNGNILSDYINRNNFERFTIIIDWECSSAAFTMLFDLKCNVIIRDSAFATVHESSNKLEWSELGNKKSISSFLKAKLSKDNDRELKEFILAGFTNEEVEIFKSGEDLIFDSIRMRLLLQNIKSIRGIK
jgi:ATP-dependent protease ClpP protease subunit